MTVEFESAVIHLSNCLPKVISTCKISSVETDLGVRVKNQERYISTLHKKDSRKAVEDSIEQQKN